MKTLVWLMGKPGSGKSTVGKLLQEKIENCSHFSFGELLKEMQKTPAPEGYTLDDQQRVYDFIKDRVPGNNVLVIDCNPYPPKRSGEHEQLDYLFDEVVNINLICSDEEGLSRLESRGREILAHDGSKSEDRLNNFNNVVLPEIEKSRALSNIIDISTERSSPEEIVDLILTNIKN